MQAKDRRIKKSREELVKTSKEEIMFVLVESLISATPHFIHISKRSMMEK